MANNESWNYYQAVPDINPNFPLLRYIPDFSVPYSWTLGGGTPDYPLIPIGIGVGSGLATRHLVQNIPAAFMARKLLRERLANELRSTARQLRSDYALKTRAKDLDKLLPRMDQKALAEWKALQNQLAGARTRELDFKRRNAMAYAALEEAKNRGPFRTVMDYLLGRPPQIGANTEGALRAASQVLQKNFPQGQAGLDHYLSEYKRYTRNRANEAFNAAKARLNKSLLRRGSPLAVGAALGLQSSLGAKTMENKRDLAQRAAQLGQSLDALRNQAQVRP